MSESSIPNSSTHPVVSSESAMILMQMICEAMQIERKRAMRHITTSFLGIIVSVGATLIGVLLCEIKYFHGTLDLATVMFFNILLISTSYYITLRLFCVLDIAREEYCGIIKAATKGIHITPIMEMDFEAGKCVNVQITPELTITIHTIRQE